MSLLLLLGRGRLHSLFSAPKRLLLVLVLMLVLLRA
jgi:hypothetical protein